MNNVVFSTSGARKKKKYHNNANCIELRKNGKDIRPHKESCISMVAIKCSRCYGDLDV